MTASDLAGKLAQFILTPLMTLMLAVAVLVFVYGIFEYLRTMSSGGNADQGKQHMIWGIVGFVIMTAAYAIIQMVLGTFGISQPGSFQTSGSSQQFQNPPATSQPIPLNPIQNPPNLTR